MASALPYKIHCCSSNVSLPGKTESSFCISYFSKKKQKRNTGHMQNSADLDERKKQPCSQGPLSTSRKYPGYGWSRVYTCQLQTHRGWVLNKLQLQLSSPSLRSYLWNLLKSSRRVTSRNHGTFSR